MDASDGCQVDAIDIFHDDVVLLTDLPEVVDLDDVGMLQLTQKSGFANQLTNEVVVHRETTMEPLQGDASSKTVRSHTLGQEDICHAPLSDLVEEAKLPLEAQRV